MNKWTRNQKILLAGVIVTLVIGLINSYFLYTTSNKQIIIRQDINNLKSNMVTADMLNVTGNVTIGGMKIRWNGTHGIWEVP